MLSCKQIDRSTLNLFFDMYWQLEIKKCHKGLQIQNLYGFKLKNNNFHINVDKDVFKYIWRRCDFFCYCLVWKRWFSHQTKTKFDFPHALVNLNRTFILLFCETKVCSDHVIMYFK